MPRFKFDVFLSFASLNEQLARPLYEELKRSGLIVFWSDETLRARRGGNWHKIIEESLESSRHMVLLWTPEAKKSKYVELEYRTFHSEKVHDDNRLLIPVLSDGSEVRSLPAFLRLVQTYPLNGDTSELVTRLGGRFEPLAIENARLRDELEKATRKIASLEKDDGKVQRAAFDELRKEHEELERNYSKLENHSAELTLTIQEKDGRIKDLQNRISHLARESADKKNKPSVKALAKTLTDDHGFEFILIEPGSFMMGDDSIDYAKPVHNVEITRPFYLGKYQVTQAEWKAITGKTPSQFKGERHPVERISWNDVQDFLKKVNNGQSVYRMPTEAQWEYACRADTTAAYSFGNGSGDLREYAWYWDNSSDGTKPVGQKKPNAWGLYDVHGNVWEWVQDWYSDDYYKQFENKTAVDPTGPEKGTDRVFRGGSWGDKAAYLRSADRNLRHPGGAYSRVGFRLLRTIP